MVTPEGAALIAAAAAAGPVYVGGVSADRVDRVTDWYGRTLGRARVVSRVRLPRWSYIHGRDVNAYRVTIGGRDYYGRSSPGVLIRLKAYK